MHFLATCVVFNLKYVTKLCRYTVILVYVSLRCCDVLFMFVLSKWQCVALPMRWRAWVHAHFYCYHTFLDHTTNISRKMHTPLPVSASGAQNNGKNCHLDKTNMDKTSQHLFVEGFVKMGKILLCLRVNENGMPKYFKKQ